jgi:ADP-ribose pyrophosphatase YjhB (NUDIX family)
MTKPKLIEFPDHSNQIIPTHLSVGAIIKNNKGEILMIDRLKQPFGWACPAGHIDDGEESLEALLREVKEETGLDVISYTKFDIDHLNSDYRDCPQEPCSRNINQHLWFIYNVVAEGNLIFKSDEVKAIKWCSIDEIKELKLEKVWEYWLTKLNII